MRISDWSSDVCSSDLFLVDCAKDPRFNADNILHELNLVTALSWLHKLLYSYALIPITKQRLMEREAQFAWIHRTDVPDWGRGRDDGMTPTKYLMPALPPDDIALARDLPALRNLTQTHHPS